MIILASKSPRRKELMSKYITPFFVIEVSHIDESSSYSLSPKEAVQDIARRKGEDIAKNHPNDFVISADTIVVLNNRIIGKPKDKEDAKRILNSLSNNSHEVYTAYHFSYKGKSFTNIAKSIVTFNPLSEELVDRYIASNSPMDKAGAYGIQDNEVYPIISSLEGSKNNVIGFPVEQIKRDLESLHIHLDDYK